MPTSDDIYGIETTIATIGGKWKLLILFHIAGQRRRYGELRRLIPQITEKMLIQQLRELEQDDMIVRTAYPTIPPKVEYTLSEHAKTICPLLQSLCEWGKSHREYLNHLHKQPSTAPDSGSETADTVPW